MKPTQPNSGFHESPTIPHREQAVSAFVIGVVSILVGAVMTGARVAVHFGWEIPKGLAKLGNSGFGVFWLIFGMIAIVGAIYETIMAQPSETANDDLGPDSRNQSVPTTSSRATPFSSVGDHAVQITSGPIAQKSQIAYVLFAWFFGIFGFHNFYARRMKCARAQFLLALLSFGILIPINWLWAMIEIVCVSRDGRGVPFK